MAESLQSFIEEVNGPNRLRVEFDYGGGFVRLQTSEAERRQAAQDIRSSEDIVIELLRNARDAHAGSIFVATWRDAAKRHFTVIDDGCGIPAYMHGSIFEPRVTSKLDTSHMDNWGMHGRGMALFSISANADEAYVASSDVDMGTAIAVISDTDRLPERTDQSTFPTFELEESNKVNVRGPKNIVRTVCEFAIDARATCSVYIGSPSEICATLYSYGRATLSEIDRVFCRDVTQLPLVKRLATASDPAEFAELAKLLGLAVSERTARRVMDGEIEEVDAVLDRITISKPGRKRTGARRGVMEDSRSFKLHADDAEALSKAVMREFPDIAERYYLEAGVEPVVRARKDRITITIPVVKLD